MISALPPQADWGSASFCSVWALMSSRTSPSCTGTHGWITRKHRNVLARTCGCEVRVHVTFLLWFPLSEAVLVLLWQQDVQSYRQEVNGDPERALPLLTDTRWPKQNPKYSFLSYHATQHERNITCTLLRGGVGGGEPHSCFQSTLWTNKGRGQETQNPDWMSRTPHSESE